MTYEELRSIERIPADNTPTPNQRSGILVWDVGFHTLNEIHCHRNAGELFYFFHGRCRVVAGPEDRVVGPDTVIWMHPEAPHMFEVVGDEPVALFLIVTCNQFPTHTWPPDFIPGAGQIGMEVLAAEPGSMYIFEPFLRTEVVRLRGGEKQDVTADPASETVTFVIRGVPHVTAGPLSGTCPAYGELCVPPGRALTFENRDDTRDVDLLISRVNDDPGRPCIDTPFERGDLAARYQLPMPRRDWDTSVLSQE